MIKSQEGKLHEIVGGIFCLPTTFALKDASWL